MPDAADARAVTDTHAHLLYVAERRGAAFLGELSAAYSGSEAIVVDVGVDHDDFPRRKAAFGSLGFVRLTAGIWPDGDSIRDWRARVDSLEGHVADKACVAVGECGLDYHWMNGGPEEQARLFSAQAELAAKYGKPIVVHSREAHADTLAIVKAFASKVPVVIHCFGYGAAECLEYVGLGCFVSFAGNVTYKKADALRAACCQVPDERLLVETDSPYMNPEPLRGRDATPLDISRTYDFIASLRGTDREGLADTGQKNARAVFGAG